jgi:elongation factor P
LLGAVRAKRGVSRTCGDESEEEPMLTVADLRKGMKFIKDGNPYTVVEFLFVKPGKGQGLYKCKIRNLISGSQYEETYRSGETFQEADVEERRMQYLYQEEDRYCFMDNTTYEQIYIDGDALGEDRLYLSDNLPVDVLLFDGRPIGCKLPNFVELQITECEPGIRGDTATGAQKPARLSTGALLQVPLFVNDGEWIKIDTRTYSYVERVKR